MSAPRLFAGPVHGPTHRSAPTESIAISISPGRAGGDRAPPLPVDRGAQQRADVPKAWLPPTKFRAEIWGVSHRHRPLRPAGDEGRGTARRGRRALRVVAESRRDCPGQRRTAERLRRGREGWVGIGAEIIPKVSSNAGQSLSQPAADSSLCTREPFPAGDGGIGRGMRIAASLRSSQ